MSALGGKLCLHICAVKEAFHILGYKQRFLKTCGNRLSLIIKYPVPVKATAA